MIVLRLLLLLFVQSTLTGSEKINSEPLELYKILKNDQGWVFNEEQQGIEIAMKKIEGHEIPAIMVNYETSVSLSLIQSILMDVENYSTFLKSSGAMVTKQLEKSESSVVGYQFIPVSVPFINDRHYFFKMMKNNLKENNSDLLVKWFLLDENANSNNGARSYVENGTYLKYGAGLWMAEKTNSKSVRLSYRLFMDPGGFIPLFLTEKVNEISILNLFKDVLAEAERRMNL